jgi:orotate phosphoribosyltransferase
MKSIDDLIQKAIQLKEQGMTEAEIGNELHLSTETINWLLTHGNTGEKPPADVKIGWRSIGVYGERIGYISQIMTSIIVEELERQNTTADTVLGLAINGIPFATLISEELGMELSIYRPHPDRNGAGAFSSNYASVEGKKVIIVDDVMSSGTTLRATIKDLEKRGAVPVLAIVITNKSESNTVDGVPLRALLRTRALM